MSAGWATEYLSALSARDTQEQANKEIYDAFTALAEKKTSPRTVVEEKTPASPTLAPVINRVSSWSRSATPTTLATPASPRWQEELAQAQKRRAELETSLAGVTAELEEVQARLKAEEKRAGELENERNILIVKLRDRVEELKAKAKLVQDVQDEAVALDMQLNVSEEKNEKLAKENADLIQRWMTSKRKEADAMNDASKFP